MPNFVLNRNFSLATLHGHIIDFKKGQPTYVAPVCIKDVVAIGATPIEGEVDVLGPDSDENKPVALTATEREAAIIAAFKTMEARGQREDFTAAGSPAKVELVKLLGFDAEKKEYDPLWVAYVANKNSAE